jgi:uncharacterized protein with HEPN domain
MFPRAWTERIRDILDAIAEIETFTQGMTFDAFRNDPKTIRAVELDFIIIGEAASGIPETMQAAHPELPWYLMRALRNRLVHVYFSVDPKVVWDTIHSDLPPLMPLLESLLRDTCP